MSSVLPKRLGVGLFRQDSSKGNAKEEHKAAAPPSRAGRQAALDLTNEKTLEESSFSSTQGPSVEGLESQLTKAELDSWAII